MMRSQVICNFAACFVAQDCEFNPKKPMICDKGCGLTMPMDEMPVKRA